MTISRTLTLDTLKKKGFSFTKISLLNQNFEKQMNLCTVVLESYFWLWFILNLFHENKTELHGIFFCQGWKLYSSIKSVWNCKQIKTLCTKRNISLFVVLVSKCNTIFLLTPNFYYFVTTLRYYRQTKGSYIFTFLMANIWIWLFFYGG